MTDDDPESGTSVTVQRAFDASPERVFDAWLEPADIKEWMFPSSTDEIMSIDIDPVEGGDFSFKVRRDDDVINHTGQYTEINRPRRLAFNWGIEADEGEDHVTITILPKNPGSEVTLTHELAPEWADYADRTAKAWTSMLDALINHLED